MNEGPELLVLTPVDGMIIGVAACAGPGARVNDPTFDAVQRIIESHQKAFARWGSSAMFLLGAAAGSLVWFITQYGTRDLLAHGATSGALFLASVVSAVRSNRAARQVIETFRLVERLHSIAARSNGAGPAPGPRHATPD